MVGSTPAGGTPAGHTEEASAQRPPERAELPRSRAVAVVLHADGHCARPRPARCVEDGEIHLILTKGSKGVTWPAVFQGHTKVRTSSRGGAPSLRPPPPGAVGGRSPTR